MSECKIAGSLETAKKDIVRIALSSFFPFPDRFGRMNGITLAVPLSGSRVDIFCIFYGRKIGKPYLACIFCRRLDTLYNKSAMKNAFNS